MLFVLLADHDSTWIQIATLVLAALFPIISAVQSWILSYVKKDQGEIKAQCVTLQTQVKAVQSDGKERSAQIEDLSIKLDDTKVENVEKFDAMSSQIGESHATLSKGLATVQKQTNGILAVVEQKATETGEANTRTAVAEGKFNTAEAVADGVTNTQAAVDQGILNAATSFDAGVKSEHDREKRE